MPNLNGKSLQTELDMVTKGTYDRIVVIKNMRKEVELRINQNGMKQKRN
ncbi:MAG: hypothetical protein ABS808_00060 [Wolbachia endosymbiont of Polyergus mexicanus]|uniref:Uncharacterized protein n=1 Tax=Wolbachia endosymbiont of Polyergus mexicanus TaxID=3171167 RepID=A0AAU7YKF8_9RICK